MYAQSIISTITNAIFQTAKPAVVVATPEPEEINWVETLRISAEWCWFNKAEAATDSYDVFILKSIALQIHLMTDDQFTAWYMRRLDHAGLNLTPREVLHDIYLNQN
jgi:hypothetical protein